MVGFRRVNPFGKATLGGLWSCSEHALWSSYVNRTHRAREAVSLVTVKSTNGVELALHDFGGSGPTLLLCHATGFNAPAYRPMVDVLTSSFHVVSFDFRGHGASSMPNDGDFAWHKMTDDLLAIIDHLGGGPFYGFGHSMGATTILLTELRRAGSFSACWLFEPIVFPHDLAPRNSTMAAGARKRRAVFDSREQALARYASRPPLSSWRADALAGYVQGGFYDLDDGSVHLACHPETEAAMFKGASTYTSEIASFVVPAVIGGGMTTPDPGPGNWVPAIAAALPNATAAEYRNLTHFGPFQDPTRIAADVAEFFGRATGSR